jgi:hypothetical protein
MRFPGAAPRCRRAAAGGSRIAIEKEPYFPGAGGDRAEPDAPGLTSCDRSGRWTVREARSEHSCDVCFGAISRHDTLSEAAPHWIPSDE